MSNITIFENEQFGSVRTLQEGEKILFCASDVAKALGYTRPADAVRQHCRYTVKRSIPHPQGESTLEMNFIPEGDVYRLIIRSKLPSAEQFETWLFDEVLPTIRKTGSYAIDAKKKNEEAKLKEAELWVMIADRTADKDIKEIALMYAGKALNGKLLLKKAEPVQGVIGRDWETVKKWERTLECLPGNHMPQFVEWAMRRGLTPNDVSVIVTTIQHKQPEFRKGLCWF